MVTRDGYILTKDQELWGDTLSYYRNAGHVVAYGNIQVDDFKQKILAFGDYAEYWSDPGNMLLTRNPSIVSYDLSQSDSVFMRGDTLQIFTISLLAEREQREREAAEKAAAEQRAKESVAPKSESKPNTTPQRSQVNQPNENNAVATQQRDVAGATGYIDDELNDEQLVEQPIDSIAQDSVPQLSAKEQKALEHKQAKEAARKAKEAKKREKAAIRKVHLDSIAKVRQAKATAILEKMKAKEMERIAKDSVRRAERREKLLAKGGDVAELDSIDSLARVRNERVLRQMEQRSDSVDKPKSNIPQAEDMIVENEGDIKSGSEQNDSISADSVYRLVKAYRNVKMFRKDAQMVCDSLVSSSQDSIVHLYLDPVLWNGTNQLASKMMDLHTKNQKLVRAEFDGTPIMVAIIDSTYYNQVAGKKMIAYFRDNDIYRNDVDGNVQTIYFQRENEQTTLVTEMVYLESASASFYIEDRELVGMTYRNDVPFTMYPINQVPESQPLKLANFKWVPTLRPELKDVFDRTIRPSRRENEERKRPTFNIVNAMDRRKERLISSGEWIDREDELTPELIEWRDSRM
ncbi:MAG: hypothetical protein IIW00_01630, partial [Alistipes sp.]|nr:hypothetical protein [Alistipes sp.]